MGPQHWDAPTSTCTVRQVDYDLFKRRFGRAVKKFRKLLEKNQTTLAIDSGTDQGSISRIEAGKQGFDSELLFKLSHDGLNVGLDTIMQEVYRDLPDDAGLGRVIRAWPTLSPKSREYVLHMIALELTTTPPTSSNNRTAASSKSGRQASKTK